MPKEPEQVLPQNWTAAAADMERRTVNDHSGRQEKARRRCPIHQLHDDRSLKRRKREQEQECGDKLRPDEKWQAHPGQAFGAQLNDGGDEIDSAEQRRRDQENESEEPQRLSVEERMEPWPFVGDIRKLHIRSA